MLLPLRKLPTLSNFQTQYKQPLPIFFGGGFGFDNVWHVFMLYKKTVAFYLRLLYNVICKELRIEALNHIPKGQQK